MSRTELQEKVFQASDEQQTREVSMGTDYAGQGQVISRFLWLIMGVGALITLAFLWHVATYGPLGKGFAGVAVLWLGMRAYSQFTQGRGY